MKHPLSRNVLMTPGPVEEPLAARLAGLQATMHHRTGEFEAIFAEVQEGMRWLLETEGPVALLSSSGTGALEASVANLVGPDDSVAVVVAGKFGERWRQLLTAYQSEPVVLEKAPGEVATPEEVRDLVDETDATLVFTTLQETSTGVRHDIQGFGEALRGTDALLVVDAVSGLGALPYSMDAWGVDVTVSGSQKGLLSPPGLAMLAWGPRAEARRLQGNRPRFYFDLKSYLEKPTRAPFTPPITVVAQVAEVLREMRRVGKPAMFESIARQGRAAVAAGVAMGLEALSPAGSRSPAMTTLLLPEGVDGTRVPGLVEGLTGIRIAGGQDGLKGRIVRIGHMGATTPGDLLGCLAGLEAALNQLGAEIEPGVGVKAAARVLFNDDDDDGGQPPGEDA